MTTTTAPTGARPLPDGGIVPTRPCEPWCTVGETAHHTHNPADRYCVSAETVVPRTLGKPEHRDDGQWVYDHVVVFSRRMVHTGLHVALFLQEEDVDLELTADEARAVAAALIQHANLIEGVTP